MSEISVVVVGSTSINSVVGNGDTVNVTVGGDSGGGGAAATIEAGSVTTIDATQTASVTNVGTAYAAKFNFSLPRGLTGSAGPANSLSISKVSTGTTAAVSISGTAPSQSLSFVLQPGPTGPANSLSIGSVTTGTTAAVSISGTAPSQSLSFVLPQGPTGPANSLSIGSVTTGTTAAVTITGSSPSQSISFVLPQGPKGDTGSVGPQGPAGPPINLADETPQPLGAASAGTALTAARADHVHDVGSVAYSSLAGIPSTFTPAIHQHVVSDVTGLQTALDSKQPAGTYATLVGGTVPSSQLPSFVDDVREAANFGALPATGDAGVIYVTVDTRKIYRWSGSAYVEISPSPGTTTDVPEGTNLYHTFDRAAAAAPVQSVAGRTGAVTLSKSDVGLSSVPNTDATARANHTGTQAASTISDFATEAAKYGPVVSVAGRTGTVTLGKSDVGLANVPNTDATARSSHSGTQLASTISDFASESAKYGPVTSVAGRAGAVTLAKADVGLGSVDNTADASKPVSTAQAAADSAVASTAASDATSKADSAQAYAIQRANHTGTQAISTVSGLQTALDAKQASGSYAASVHTHAVADVTGLQTALDGKQASGSYAAASHSHAIADVTGLQTALDGKAATSHTHDLSSLTQSGATTGQVPTWNGSAWAAATPSAGGGGGGSYTLPTASASVLGGVKIGSGLTITDGVLAASGGGSGSIVSATTVAGFPATGSTASVIYVATDTARAYIWSGAYIEVGAVGIDSELRALFVPGAPTSVTASAGNAQATVSWTAPSVLSQTPITGYVVEWTPSGGSASTVSTGSTSTSYTKTSLTNGTSVTFRVAAVNALGQGAWSSASSSVTPAATVPLVMGNRYVGGNLGSYTTWSLSGTGTSADPIVGVMRGINDQSSEWRFTANVSGTLTISARNVPEDGWGQWQVIRITGNATIAVGEFSASNVVTRTASVVAGEQYKIVNYNSGTSFTMGVA